MIKHVSLVSSNVAKYCNEYKKHQKQIKDDYSFNGFNWCLQNAIKVEGYLNNSRYHAKPLIFKYKNINNFEVRIATNDKYKYCLKKKSDNQKVEFYNLKNNSLYFYKIICLETNNTIDEGIIKTNNYPRLMKFGDLLNVRDFGGKNINSNIKIKNNLLFRGAEIVKKSYYVSDSFGNNIQTHFHKKSVNSKDIKDLQKFLKNGIEIDLRGDKESNLQANSILGASVEYFRFPINSYDFLFKTENKQEINNVKKIFELISKADVNPIYIHCWGGADRTGTICFLLGGLLGLSYSDLVIDYELTSFSGNVRNHYKKNETYEWMHYIEMIDFLENYRDKNKLENNISKIIEHLLINKFLISYDIIRKIKSIFLEVEENN